MIIIQHLGKVRDTRSHINQVYPVIEVAFLVISAMLCGQNKWTDIRDFGEGNMDWLRQHLPYENGIPTRHNIAAIMKTIVPETLLEAMVGWVNEHRLNNNSPIISMDGKVLKGAKASKLDNPLYMVSAFDVDQGLVLTHRPCEGKGKEIDAIRSLLDALNIKGTLLTADALHCQVETLQKVVDKGGNMLVQVKQNQSTLLNEIDAQFQAYWALPQEKQECHATHDKGHGRTEIREVYMLPASFDTGLREKWPMVKSLVAVVRDRTIGGKGSYETSYYVCTDNISLELAAQASRKHWHIENQHHWALDVIFKEDEQQMHAGDSALNMACCRRFVQNLYRKSEGKESVPRKMNKAAWNYNYRTELLFT
ncbi:ISAs1 family transposase [Vibrio tritonius]|uniref:ISAs1 family transposase n=1 Tax=Vibrio tritonius TaxID=1435069 RepID=UPI00315D15A1